MAGALPNGIRTSDLKSRIMHLAQTSVYQIKMSPTPEVIALMNTRGFNFNLDSPNIELLCNSVSLPGTSLQTAEVTNNYAGVTEKMANRRSFDTTMTMTFYVDRNYKVIDFFESWMDWISNQTDTSAYKNVTASYRMNYPATYRGQVFISKFEKDGYGTANSYTLVGAYPISINSTPLSYSASQIMEYTVNFTFLRYTREKLRWRQSSNSLLNNASRVTSEVLAAFNSNTNLTGFLRDDVGDEGNTIPGTAN
jgi:hypothetical protein